MFDGDRSRLLRLFMFMACLLDAAPAVGAQGEETVLSIAGKGHHHVRTFKTDGTWEVRWQFDGLFEHDLFQIAVYDVSALGPPLIVDDVTQQGPGTGAKRQQRGGHFELDVIGIGSWTITVIDLPE